MTKGSRSLNGLFIAFDLFQTAAVKTIMFSHWRYGRGERTDRAGNNHPPPKKKKIHPGTGLNDELSHTSGMAVVNGDFIEDQGSLSLPLGGRAEGK